MKCKKEQVLSAQQERSSGLCRFIDECSSLDFSIIGDDCYRQCEKCGHYSKIIFLESMMG